MHLFKNVTHGKRKSSFFLALFKPGELQEARGYSKQTVFYVGETFMQKREVNLLTTLALVNGEAIKKDNRLKMPYEAV